MGRKKSKIREAARGKHCSIRIPNVCNGNPETVVHAHINGAGMGRKAPDFQGCPTCSSCHAFIDKHSRIAVDVEELPESVRAYIYLHDAIDRYQEELHYEGLILTPGSK